MILWMIKEMGGKTIEDPNDSDYMIFE